MIAALYKIQLVIVVLLPTAFDTIEVYRVLWTSVGLLGLLICGGEYRECKKDYAYVAEKIVASAQEGRLLVAKQDLRNNAIRGENLVLFTVVGFMALIVGPQAHVTAYNFIWYIFMIMTQINTTRGAIQDRNTRHAVDTYLLERARLPRASRKTDV